MGRKKKETQSYTHEQQLVLRKHRDHFTGSIAANMKIFLRGSIGHALLLFKMAIDGKGYIDAKYLGNNDVCHGPGKESEEAGVQNDNGNALTEESNGDGKETQLNGTIQTGEASEVDWSLLMALVSLRAVAATGAAVVRS